MHAAFQRRTLRQILDTRGRYRQPFDIRARPAVGTAPGDARCPFRSTTSPKFGEGAEYSGYAEENAESREAGSRRRKRCSRLREHHQLSNGARARLPHHLCGCGCLDGTGRSSAGRGRPCAAQARLETSQWRGSGVSPRAPHAGIDLSDVLRDRGWEAADHVGGSEASGRIRASGRARFAGAQAPQRMRTAVDVAPRARRHPRPDRVCRRPPTTRRESSAGQGVPRLRLALPRP
jgi:hypothetical protein